MHYRADLSALLNFLYNT